MTSHSVTLSGLTPGTTYYLRVTSIDAAGNTATAPSVGNAPASFVTARTEPAPAPSPSPSYLFKEGFEGSGFENSGWITEGANPNYTALPLDGAQSLHCTADTYISREFPYASGFNMYLRVRWNTWSSWQHLISWENGRYSTISTLRTSDDTLGIRHGSIQVAGTTRIVPNRTYHVWVERTKGTGTNGTMKLFVSTTANKPAKPEAVITKGNGDGTERMHVGCGYRANMIFDRILVDDTPIGSNP